MTYRRTISYLSLSASLMALMAAGSLPVLAQSVDNGAADNEADDNAPIEEIVTIGTRVKGRTATQTAVPIDIISAADLERNTGLFETGELLQRLAPSFNYSRTQVSDGSDIFRPATLRGLGPDQVLVLVNGKRRHSRSLLGLAGTVGEGAAGTDLNAIPAASIKRIEILRDGAAAQYGSDAIAGVINIVLKDSVNEISLGGIVGQTYKGDGERVQFQLNGGVPLGGNGGFVNFTAEYRHGGATNRADISPFFGDVRFQHGDAKTKFYGLFMNAALPLGDNFEVYAFGGYSNSDALGAGFYRFATQADRAVPQLFPDGFLPRDTNESEDFSIAGGIRGDIAPDWSLDLSIAYGQNDYDFGARNTVNASIAADFFNKNPGATAAEVAANAGPTEGFSGSRRFEQLTFNADLAGQFDGVLPNPLYVAVGFEYRDETFKTVSGQFESFSCGSSATPQAIPSIVDPTVFAVCGFQAFPGFGPDSAGQDSRNNFALYIDTETNLTDRLLIGLAGRYEDYGSVGDKFTGKVSGRFEVTENFALRGAAQTGFRAPSLQQLGSTFVTTNAGANGLTETLLAKAGSAFPGFFGINNLKIETTDSFSIGLVWEPMPNLTVTVDGFLINIDNRIVLGSPLGPGQLDSVPLAKQFLIDNLIDQANFFSNGVNTQTKGLDIVINHKAEVGRGDLSTTLAIDLNRTTVQRINTPPGIGERLILPEPSERFIEQGQPRSRVNLSFDYGQDRWKSLLRLNYIGTTKTSFFTAQGLGIPLFLAPILGFNDESVLKPGAAVLVDFELSYQVTENVEFAIGGNNLLDQKPNKLADNAVLRFITSDPSGKFGNIKFPFRGLAYGLNGGFYYARLAAHF